MPIRDILVGQHKASGTIPDRASAIRQFIIYVNGAEFDHKVEVAKAMGGTERVCGTCGCGHTLWEKRVWGDDCVTDAFVAQHPDDDDPWAGHP
jgi:hypothetical protein